MKFEKINIALAGFGNIGSYFYRILEKNKNNIYDKTGKMPIIKYISVKNINKKLIPLAHHWLILHGRYTCLARNPKCDSCEISKLCNYYNK